MKGKNRRIIIKAASITAILLVILSVAFAALSTSLNINFSTVTQNALKWNVGFKGSSVTPIQEGTSDTGLSCGSASVTSSTVTIADSTLSKPDDKCTYPLTIENTGDISANLAAIAISQPTNMSCVKEDDATMICGNITIKLTTESGADFTAGVTVEPGEEYDLNLIVHYTGTTLSSSSVIINSSKVTFAYKQAAKRTGTVKPDGIREKEKICRRATALHTETCTKSYDGYGCKKYDSTIITYGNLGMSGTLTAGDAFDCDVNGDGVYDAETERFYYVSGLNGEDTSGYAVLFYYNNVSQGQPNSTAQAIYAINNENYLGPTNGYLELPTTEQWPNVSLKSQRRQIYNELGGTKTQKTNYICDDDTWECEKQIEYFDLQEFTYSGRAARLLATQELEKACGIKVGTFTSGELNSCKFLLEHTSYSTDNESVNASYYWLETANSTDYNIWDIYAFDPHVNRDAAANPLGIRPVIEVPLSDISY